PVNRSLIAAPNSVTGRNVVCGYSPEQAASRDTATIGRSAASGRTLSVRRGIPSFSIILPEGRRVNGFGPIAARQIITRDNRGQATRAARSCRLAIVAHATSETQTAAPTARC